MIKTHSEASNTTHLNLLGKKEKEKKRRSNSSTGTT